jgi:UDP-N-acetylmuramoylalanine-D-glutamate ligase
MDGQEIRNKKVAILGAARSGLAAAKLLKSLGAHVFVSGKSAELTFSASWSLPVGSAKRRFLRLQAQTGRQQQRRFSGRSSSVQRENVLLQATLDRRSRVLF